LTIFQGFNDYQGLGRVSLGARPSGKERDNPELVSGEGIMLASL